MIHLTDKTCRNWVASWSWMILKRKLAWFLAYIEYNKTFDGVSVASFMDFFFFKLGMDVSFQNMTSCPKVNQCRNYTVRFDPAATGQQQLTLAELCQSAFIPLIKGNREVKGDCFLHWVYSSNSPMQIVNGIAPVVFYMPTKWGEAHSYVQPGQFHPTDVCSDVSKHRLLHHRHVV